MRDADRYLKRRGRRWHYVRRVPGHVAHLDSRGMIQTSLKTASIDTARARRDALEEADDLHWASLLATGAPSGIVADQRYQAAKSRALALGFQYRSVEALAADASIDELVRRIEALEVRRDGTIPRHDVDALLGGVARPSVTVTAALETYFEVFGPIEMKGRSASQRASWEKVKRRAISNFVSVIGDIPMDEITRDHANQFFDWWRDRVTGATGDRALSGNSANRDIGNMRALYREHFKRLGEEDRANPFRNLNFADPKSAKKDVPPFPPLWIAERILRPAAFEGINRDGALIILSLIETGARPSEICNLDPGHIRLDDQVPHIQIRFRKDRAIKTESSERDIPLVGVSLAAMRAAPDGFARYRDRETALSSNLMKHFRKRDLFPSADHRIYSFRHAFEKRMLEAGIDYGLRCTLMGHANDRPEYGDGGSLVFRRDQIARMALPFDPALIDAIAG